MSRLAIVGFGEVGQRVARDLEGRTDLLLCVWDRQFQSSVSPPSRALAVHRVVAGESLGDTVRGASIVLSAVTAAEAVGVARDASPNLARGAWYIDVNSISPGSRAEAARFVDASGARYLEAAVMSPIDPCGISSPILLGGPHAPAFDPSMLGLAGARVYSTTLGRASAAKLCRSVLVKGLEALVAESLCAARRHGVLETVLDSLGDTFAAADREEFARYLLSRTLRHGVRRSAEMEEAAHTMRQAGIEPAMCEAIVRRQQWAGTRGIVPGNESLTGLIDAALAESTC